MKVTTERLENCQVQVVVELDAAEVDKRLRGTARKLSRQFNVPGYRRGKAPFHAVMRVFGQESVQQQGLDEWGNDLYEQAISEIEYEPYEAGELIDVEWDPFRMKVLVPIQPEVDLGAYRDVRVPFEVDEITDEQIDDYLADLQKQHSQWVPVERPATFGDQVVLDMEGKVGEHSFMNNQEHEMQLDEESVYPMPGFHAEIVGMMVGEDKTFTLTVPEEDYDEDVAGQEGTITVHLHTVKEQDLPSLDDEFAMMVGDYETLETLKVATRMNMEDEAQRKAEAEYLDKVFVAMIDSATKMEYPVQAIDRETDLALSQMERNLAASGIQLDAYLGMIGKSREMYKQELRPASEERLKRRLVLSEIAEREAITIEDDELDAETERLVEMMGEQGDEMRAMLETPGGRLSMVDDLMVNRVQDLIVQIGKGEAPPKEQAESEVEADADAEEDAVSDSEGQAEDIEVDES